MLLNSYNGVTTPVRIHVVFKNKIAMKDCDERLRCEDLA